MEKETLVPALLGLLLVVSAVQAYELLQIKASVEAAPAAGSGGFSSYEDMMAAHHGGSPAASSQFLPKGLQNLPSQVGGC